MHPDNAPPSRRIPAPLKVAVALLAASALGWGAMGVFEAFVMRADRVIVGAGAAVLMVAYAVGLVLLARGLWRLRTWARGPVVATQLIQLPVAYSFAGGATTWVAALLGGVSLAVLGCVLSPPATLVLVPDAAADATD